MSEYKQQQRKNNNNNFIATNRGRRMDARILQHKCLQVFPRSVFSHCCGVIAVAVVVVVVVAVAVVVSIYIQVCILESCILNLREL